MNKYLVSLEVSPGVWEDSGRVFNSPGEAEQFVVEQELKASISQKSTLAPASHRGEPGPFRYF